MVNSQEKMSLKEALIDIIESADFMAREHDQNRRYDELGVLRRKVKTIAMNYKIDLVQKQEMDS